MEFERLGARVSEILYLAGRVIKLSPVLIFRGDWPSIRIIVPSSQA
jgi:hypothetical protein